MNFSTAPTLEGNPIADDRRRVTAEMKLSRP
ncbi:hypothetical protein EC836_103145 [Erwinia sp. JUb26]|nr:hypothetical protein EC836_103145 [Erwinia sp. JUb26]